MSTPSGDALVPAERANADKMAVIPGCAFLADLLERDGYDVLTTQAAGRAAQRIPDPDQLAFATSLGRAIFTHDTKDYQRIAREWAAEGREQQASS